VLSVDRRRSDRSNLYYYLKVINEGNVIGYLIDISRTGVLMTTQEPMELDKELSIKIDLGHDDQEKLIEAKVLIVRSFASKTENWFDIGMEFVAIDPVDKALIESTINDIGL